MTVEFVMFTFVNSLGLVMRLIMLDMPEEVVTKVLLGPFFCTDLIPSLCSLIKVLPPGLGFKLQHQVVVYGYSLPNDQLLYTGFLNRSQQYLFTTSCLLFLGNT